MLLGNRAVFHPLDADVDGLADQTPDQASATAVARLQEALDAEWQQRQPTVILWGVLFSLLATAAAAAVIAVSVKLSGLITRRALRLPHVAALERLDDEMAEVLRRPLVAALTLVNKAVLAVIVVVSLAETETLPAPSLAQA